jgi:hypothetical protein
VGPDIKGIHASTQRWSASELRDFGAFLFLAVWVQLCVFAPLREIHPARWGFHAKAQRLAMRLFVENAYPILSLIPKQPRFQWKR